MRENKKGIDRLLKNNTFLINSSICLVVLLFICYFGINLSIKETYSAEKHTITAGQYIWWDFEHYDERTLNLGMASFRKDINFSAKNINYNYFVVSVIDTNKLIDIYYNDRKIFSLEDEECKDPVWDEDLMEWITEPCGTVIGYNEGTTEEDTIMWFKEDLILDKTGNDNLFYNWFIKNITPYNQCYYKSENKEYKWTNDPTFGTLKSDLNQSKCEEENNKMTVTYYKEDGTVLKTDTIFKGEYIELPNQSKTGYLFAGWYTEKEGGVRKGGFEDKIKLSEDTKLYAQFEPLDINIDFGSYKNEGNYIIVDVGTTQSDFKNNITVNESGVNYIFSDKTATTISTNLGLEISLADGRKDNYIFVALGDVDGNGKIGTMDYVKIYNHIKNNTLNGIEKVAADYKQDGSINTLDYVKIYNQLNK